MTVRIHLNDGFSMTVDDGASVATDAQNAILVHDENGRVIAVAPKANVLLVTVEKNKDTATGPYASAAPTSVSLDADKLAREVSDEIRRVTGLETHPGTPPLLGQRLDLLAKILIDLRADILVGQRDGRRLADSWDRDQILDRIRDRYGMDNEPQDADEEDSSEAILEDARSRFGVR